MEKTKSKMNLKCWMSLKTWAKIMALINLIIGISIIIGGSVWLAKSYGINYTTKDAYDDYSTMKVYFMVGIAVGILSIVSGCVLASAIVQGKDSSVLLYILLEFVVLFILSIFSSMNVTHEFSIVMFGFVCLCFILWIGLYNVYGFYIELYNYNNNSVQAGVDQIVCNKHTNPLVAFPEKALDTTVV